MPEQVGWQGDMPFLTFLNDNAFRWRRNSQMLELSAGLARNECAGRSWDEPGSIVAQHKPNFVRSRLEGDIAMSSLELLS